MKKEKWIYNSKYLIFYFARVFDISFELCGYFDNRPRINLDLFFFSLTLILPFRNKWTDECDSPKWGIAFHNETFWIYRGGKGNDGGGNKWWTIDAPWKLEWVRTSFLRKDNTWEHESKGQRKSFYDTKWNGILWSETYPYTYILNSNYYEADRLGKAFNTANRQYRQATLKVSEREWRPNWTRKIPIFRKISKSIDIEFDDEVGERTGSWKGGTIGCSYEMRKNETPEQCLRRMEIERRF